MGTLPGPTEAEARKFVLDEIKGATLDRRGPIAIAGTRAFLNASCHPVSGRRPPAPARRHAAGLGNRSRRLARHTGAGRGRSAGAAPALVTGLANVTWLAAAASTTIAVLESGRMMTWGEVRPWTRPDDGQSDLSPFPILLWVDGLQQP
jgi:hypothetical protein